MNAFPTKISPIRFIVPSLVRWANEHKRLMGEGEPYPMPMEEVTFDVANRRTDPKLPFCLVSGSAQKEFGASEFQNRITADFYSSGVPDPAKWPESKWSELEDIEEARPGIFIQHLESNFRPGTGTAYLDHMTCPGLYEVAFMDSCPKEIEYGFEIVQPKEDGQETMVVHRVAFTYGATVMRHAE